MQMRGFLFDLDGTLLDSMPMWHDLDRRFLAEFGIAAPPDISDIVKAMNIEQSSAYLVQRFNLPISPAAVQQRVEALAADAYRFDLKLKNGADTLISELRRRGVICAVASVTYPSLMSAALERLGISPHLQVAMTPTSEMNGKHSPAFYQAVLEKVGLTPAETVIAEDALYAAQTAKQMGCFTIGVKDDLAKHEWNALDHLCDRTIHDWNELLCPDFLDMFS